jgi:hypothetical protein
MSLIDELLTKQKEQRDRARDLERTLIERMDAESAVHTVPFTAASSRGNIMFRLRMQGEIQPGKWARIDLEMLVVISVSTQVFGEGNVVRTARPTMIPLPLRWDVITDEQVRVDIFGLLLRESEKRD